MSTHDREPATDIWADALALRAGTAEKAAELAARLWDGTVAAGIRTVGRATLLVVELPETLAAEA